MCFVLTRKHFKINDASQNSIVRGDSGVIRRRDDALMFKYQPRLSLFGSFGEKSVRPSSRARYLLAMVRVRVRVRRGINRLLVRLMVIERLFNSVLTVIQRLFNGYLTVT